MVSIRFESFGRIKTAVAHACRLAGPSGAPVALSIEPQPALRVHVAVDIATFPAVVLTHEGAELLATAGVRAVRHLGVAHPVCLVLGGEEGHPALWPAHQFAHPRQEGVLRFDSLA